MILDQYGRPFDFAAAAREPQTARLVALHHERSEHINGLTPARLARLFVDAEQGDLTAQADLWDDMEERDSHLFAELSKRRRAVSRLDWQILPPDGATPAETEAAAWLAQTLRGLDGWRDLLWDCTDAIGKAFACVELEWGRPDGIWQPVRMQHRPQRWFQVEPGFAESIRLRDHTPGGQPLQPLSWIVHISRARSVGLARAALLRPCAWPYLFRSFSLGDWAEFLEVYGYPVRLGKYSPSATKEDKDTLLRAVLDIGRRAGGIIPEGASIDLVNAVTGDPRAFESLVAWADRAQSKAILGGTLTSQADGKTSTNALGDVHDDVRVEIRDDDAGRLAETLTRDLVYPLAVLNGRATTMRRCPRLVFDLRRAEDMKAYADALPMLVEAGLDDVPTSWVRDQLRIPPAKPGEKVMRKTGPVGVSGAGGAATVAAMAQNAQCNALATRCNALSSGIDTPHPSELLADQLEQAANPVLADWLGRIENMVTNAASLEDLRAQLLGGFGQLPTDQLALIMEAAFALSALHGAAEVANGR